MNSFQSFNPVNMLFMARDAVLDIENQLPEDSLNTTLVRLTSTGAVIVGARVLGSVLGGGIGGGIGAVAGFALERRLFDSQRSFDREIAGWGFMGSCICSAINMSEVGAVLGVGVLLAREVFEQRFGRNGPARSTPPLSNEEILQSSRSFRTTPERISIHPLILQHKPDEVLEKLANEIDLDRFRVNFLEDNLTDGSGVDAGGLQKQFMSELFQNLLDGSDSRVIKMDNGIPKVSSKATEKEKSQLRNLGKMFSTCVDDPNLFTGRVLPDCYFEMLFHPSLMKAECTDEEMVDISLPIMNRDQRWLAGIYKNAKSLSERNFNKLKEFMIFDLPDRREEINMADLKKQISEYLVEAYRPKVLAAKEVNRGFFSYRFLPNDYEPTKLSQQEIKEVAEQIQGESFSRKEIANKLVYAGSNSIIEQKTKWLKEHILDESTPKEWIENLLFTVTGQRMVTASTKINLVTSADNMCKAHTCFNQLELPTTHTDAGTNLEERADADDRQKFFNNLNVLLDYAGAGYQID